jgi:hypothetical protein
MKPSGFNPKARWDRHIPKTSDAPVQEPLDAVIEVSADFKNGTLYPRGFVYNNKEYMVTRTTYHWKEHRGQEQIGYFTVACGDDLYQLSFSSATYGWRLEKIIA